MKSLIAWAFLLVAQPSSLRGMSAKYLKESLLFLVLPVVNFFKRAISATLGFKCAGMVIRVTVS
jgi:hypothetical protein